jgi:hypothetical protein
VHLLETQEAQYGTLDASAANHSASAPTSTALKADEPISTQLIALVTTSS